MAVHGAAAPAHQYASRFLRAARPIARPGAGEHARAARGPVASRAQRPKFLLWLKVAIPPWAAERNRPKMVEAAAYAG